MPLNILEKKEEKKKEEESKKNPRREKNETKTRCMKGIVFSSMLFLFLILVFLADAENGIHIALTPPFIIVFLCIPLVRSLCVFE